MIGWLRSRRALLVVIGAVALLASACFPPILHPTLTTVAAAGSGVDFVLLSGDGNFVVVHDVGIGYRRIDRRDHTSVSLGFNFTPTAISDDGSRILLTSSTPAVWSNGQVLTLPTFFTRMSRDLTYGVFVDTDGKVKTWQTATQTITDVETNFPRPPGTTNVNPRAVSDDGRTVEYSLGPNTERFVNLDTGQVFDTPILNNVFTLAPSGRAFVEHLYATNAARLVALPSGAVVREYTPPPGFGIFNALISDSGAVAWVYEGTVVNCSPAPPPAPQVSCVTDAHAVWFTSLGMRRIETGAGNPIDADFVLSSDGRFLLFATIDPQTGGGVSGAVDMWNQVEAGRTGQISDDDKLIATSSGGGGWFEFTP